MAFYPNSLKFLIFGFLNNTFFTVKKLCSCHMLFNKSNWIKCRFLRRGENWSTRLKTSQSRKENQHTQPTYDAESGNRTRAGLVVGECRSPLRYHCSRVKNRFFCSYLVNFWSLRNLMKQLFHSRLLDMRLVIAKSAPRASLAIYHLISNARSWNNC